MDVGSVFSETTLQNAKSFNIYAGRWCALSTVPAHVPDGQLHVKINEFVSLSGGNIDCRALLGHINDVTSYFILE